MNKSTFFEIFSNEIALRRFLQKSLNSAFRAQQLVHIYCPFFNFFVHCRFFFLLWAIFDAFLPNYSHWWRHPTMKKVFLLKWIEFHIFKNSPIITLSNFLTFDRTAITIFYTGQNFDEKNWFVVSFHEPNEWNNIPISNHFFFELKKKI